MLLDIYSYPSTNQFSESLPLESKYDQPLFFGEVNSHKLDTRYKHLVSPQEKNM